jgi:hypothetical protein
LRVRCCRAFAAAILASSPVAAADGLFLPPPPTGPGGEDSITTSQGVHCSQSVNAAGGYLDLGVAGGNLNTYDNYGTIGNTGQSAIGYARIIIPLGRQPKRLDCAALYDLEIERLKQEIQMLKIGLQ